ncbi:mitochondrial carrier domain-containing protein [Cladochytrium replicatum]|nr:mitochondrial carrier domain-containing protein [Cladochytrium replicatum]
MSSVNKKPAFWVNFGAGGIAGSVGAAVTCPLDVVKTRMQTTFYQSPVHTATLATAGPSSRFFSTTFYQPPFHGQHSGRAGVLRGAWNNVAEVVGILQTIRQREGIRAWWKGLGPNLVAVFPARATYFSVYSQAKHTYTRLNNGKETSAVHMVSAATAGTAVALITNPIWLIKTRMQLQADSKNRFKPQEYRNSFHCLYRVVTEEGIRTLYKGLSASIVGLSESTLQFVMYEKLKKEIREFRSNEAIAAIASGSLAKRIPDNGCLSWSDTFGAASVAKLTAAVIAYPHEVLRTRLRQAPGPGGPMYTSLVQATQRIYREEGIRAFYGGMTAHLMRVVPNAAIMFFTYEAIVALATTHVSAPTIAGPAPAVAQR